MLQVFTWCYMCSWNVASVTVMLQVLWRCYKYGRGVQKNNCYVTSVMQCYKYSWGVVSVTEISQVLWWCYKWGYITNINVTTVLQG